MDSLKNPRTFCVADGGSDGENGSGGEIESGGGEGGRAGFLRKK